VGSEQLEQGLTMSNLKMPALPSHKPLGASGYEALRAYRKANQPPPMSPKKQAKMDQKVREDLSIGPIQRVYEDLIAKASYLNPDPQVRDTVYFMVDKDWKRILLTPSDEDKKRKWDDLKFFVKLAREKGARMEVCTCGITLPVLKRLGPDGPHDVDWKTYCPNRLCLRQKRVKVPPRVRRRR
jgi:hypothetical protein